MDYKHALRSAYNRKAQERASTKIPKWKVDVRHSFLAAMRDAQAQTLLELGAGAGHDALFFQEQGVDVTCIDLSPELVKICQQKGINAIVGDFGEMKVEIGSRDAVYAMNSLLHVPKDELPTIVRSVKSILRPGGLFFMGVYGGTDSAKVWKGDSYDPPRFFAFYPDEVLKDLLAEHFEILSFERIENTSGDNRIHFQSIIMKKNQSSE